ncbi:MAG TPA: hypothetical protein VK941_12180, partial [Gillisia sp.]|nr:hypothetical protein [Gillisia sp.]
QDDKNEEKYTTVAIVTFLRHRSFASRKRALQDDKNRGQSSKVATRIARNPLLPEKVFLQDEKF